MNIKISVGFVPNYHFNAIMHGTFKATTPIAKQLNKLLIPDGDTKSIC